MPFVFGLYGPQNFNRWWAFRFFSCTKRHRILSYVTPRPNAIMPPTRNLVCRAKHALAIYLQHNSRFLSLLATLLPLWCTPAHPLWPPWLATIERWTPFDDKKKECPDVYFAGNQPTFATSLLEGSDGQKVGWWAKQKWKTCRPPTLLTHLGPQSRFWDYQLGIRVIYVYAVYVCVFIYSRSAALKEYVI